MVDLNAKIEPWKGLGGVELYTHIGKLQKYLEESRAKTQMLGRFLVKYEIQDQLILWFNVVNGKLFKITACKEYKGFLFDRIKIGMDIENVLKEDSSFSYDDFEEVYESEKGIYIETHPQTNEVMWISVFIKEINNKDFEQGNW